MTEGHSLQQQVAAQIARAAELMSQGGRAADGDALKAQHVRPTHARPALFVAGEDKRGKSFLVNALLRTADLSPVGPEVVTAAPITFCQSATPWGRVFHYGEDQRIEQLPFEQARALATVEGNPRNEQNVRAVQLGVAAPLLETLNLVDTPGVGGLESGHAALTVQSLRSADALLFVTEAEAQLRKEELAFLQRVAARVETVIIVLTKVDMHHGWRTILADDRAILAERAPRLAECPLIPVSAMLAIRALEIDDDPEEAQAIRDESGLTALEAAIAQHVVAHAATLRDANLLRAAHGSLGGVLLRSIQTLRSLDVGAEGRQALEQERAQLQRLKQDQAGWPRKLDLEVRKLSLMRTEQAARGCVDIRRRYDQRLRDVKKREQDTLPGELVADLSALAGRLNEEAAERLTTLIEATMKDLDDATELKRSIAALSADTLTEELAGVSIGDYGMNLNDKLGVASSFSSGRSLASFASIAAGSVVAPPIGLALGIGIGAVFAFQRFVSGDQHAFVAAFTSWMQAQISDTQLTINNVFARQMLELQDEIRTKITDAMATREKEITESLKASQQLMQAEAGKRQAAQTELKTRIAGLRTTRTEIEALLDALVRAEPATVTAAAPQIQAPQP